MNVSTQCADNAHIRSGSSLNVTCVSNGSWSGLIPVCTCDFGHHVTTIDDDGREICLPQGEQPHNTKLSVLGILSAFVNYLPHTGL